LGNGKVIWPAKISQDPKVVVIVLSGVLKGYAHVEFVGKGSGICLTGLLLELVQIALPVFSDLTLLVASGRASGLQKIE